MELCSFTSSPIKIDISREQNLTLSVSNAIDSIGINGSSGYSKLYEVEVSPESKITKTQANAFSNCTSLSSANLQTVNSLGTGSFSNCTNLKSLTIGSITEIPDNCFTNCISYSDGNWANITSLGDYAFSNTAIQTLQIPSVAEIGEYAFENSNTLQTIYCTQQDSVDLENSNAFNGIKSDYTIWVKNEAYRNFYLQDSVWKSISSHISSVTQPIVSFKVGDTVEKTEKLNYNMNATPPENPEKPGYSFVGWDNAYTYVKNDLTCNANFSIITYRIDYELDGGANSPYNPVEYTITSETSVLYPATKDDYDFIKWVDLSGNEYTEIAKGSHGDRTLSAIWEESLVDLTYDTGWRGGEILSASYSTNWLNNSIRVGRVQTGNTYREPLDIPVSQTNLNMPTTLSQYVKDQVSYYCYIDDYNGLITTVGDKTAGYGGGYTGYEYLNLPGVTAIYGDAFCMYHDNNIQIKHLLIPNVKSIVPQLGHYPLVNLSSIYIPKTNNYYAVQDISGNVVDDGCVLRQLSDNMIIWGSPASCKGHVSIPQAKIIQYCAFTGCSSMTRIDIPYAESIHGWSFKDCTGLSTIVLTSVTKQTTLTSDKPYGSTTVKDPFEGVSVSNISVYVPNALVASFTTWKNKGFKVLSASQLTD